jgi:cell division protease FtsH
MDKDLGHVAYERERPPILGMPAQPNPYAREFSDETERLMDHAIRGLVGQAFDRAIEILSAHRSVHEKTAQLLLQKETLEEDDIAALRAQIAPAETAQIAPAETTGGTYDKPIAAPAGSL